jgi:hypothetical protein
MEPTFIEGWPVRRKSDGREGIISSAWIQSPGDPDQEHERVFVRSGEEFLSGMMGEPATAYEITRPVHAPDIERKAGVRHHGILPAFSSWGAYTLLYWTKGGDVLCADCATEQIDDGNDTNDDPVIDVATFDEGPDETCANCNKSIASSYGDPDADDSDEVAAADDAALARIEGSIYP